LVAEGLELESDAKQTNRGSYVAIVDAAYWIKGCSSLGRLRYAVMLRVGHGKGAALCMVDINEGVKATAPSAADMMMPRNSAIPVVTMPRRSRQTLVVARSPRGSPTQPWWSASSCRRISRSESTGWLGTRLWLGAAYFSGVVGRARGRQMDSATRGELTKYRMATLDAPSWLWSSVVALMAIHEAAYLGHCRGFAFAEAKRS
jgi:uncharacterized protein (DUF2252 family)